MVFVFFVFVLELRWFFAGKCGTYICKGSFSAYISIIIFFVSGIMIYFSIFLFHNGLLIATGAINLYNTYFFNKKFEKMKKEINKDTDFFKIYFNK